jgi:primary-amine oxidase
VRLIASLASLLVLCSVQGGAAHPLDPLSADEITAAITALRDAKHTDAATRFALIDLDEPAKDAVLAWQPGQPEARAAFVVARKDRIAYEATVDLATRQVTRWDAIPGVETAILHSEWERAQEVVVADPGWRAAMRKRGYETFDKIFCAPLTVGYLGGPRPNRRTARHRVLNVVCFDASSGSNVWGRPIEGLRALVDLDEQQVLRLVDSGAVPVSPDPADFAAAGAAPAVEPPLPTPQQASFDISGSEVRWKHWSFHFRMDPRVGPIISLASYRDGVRERLVLYRGSLAEVFVPYMDPDGGWAFRTSMDAGEYGFGLLASPLKRGIDCPGDARFIDAVLADEDGTPVAVKSRICLFERDTAGPLWRHAEIANKSYAGQPAAELVLRSIAAVGNYDYVIDWVLTETGEIRIDVGATGIVEAKGVASRSLTDATAARDTGYGTLVAPNLVAVNHDHFLSFRLDVDIDGARNTLLRRMLAPRRLANTGGRRSLWRVAERSVGREGAISPDAHGGGETWRIVNRNITDGLGRHPGYELRAGHTATSLLSPDDILQRRAGFVAAPLWVTAYDRRELYAAGPYPNQSRGDDGLPAYVARHRPVDNADIVLWCTVGFHHVPRPEDWPVMPTMWHSISLVPDGFFDRDPAVELPAAAAGR